MFLKLLQKTAEERSLPSIMYEANITLMLKPKILKNNLSVTVMNIEMQQNIHKQNLTN